MCLGVLIAACMAELYLQDEVLAHEKEVLFWTVIYRQGDKIRGGISSLPEYEQLLV
jgi:hypothetical protein